MCFKKPKPGKKSAEDIKAEKELEEMRKIRQQQLNEELRLAKERRTDEAIARAAGFMGNRSLIKGGKGGSGFLGSNVRNPKPLIKRQSGPGTNPSAPPISIDPSLLSLYGYTGGDGGGSYGGGYKWDGIQVAAY